jgi:rubredoxin
MATQEEEFLYRVGKVMDMFHAAYGKRYGIGTQNDTVYIFDKMTNTVIYKKAPGSYFKVSTLRNELETFMQERISSGDANTMVKCYFSGSHYIKNVPYVCEYGYICTNCQHQEFIKKVTKVVDVPKTMACPKCGIKKVVK